MVVHFCPSKRINGNFKMIFLGIGLFLLSLNLLWVFTDWLYVNTVWKNTHSCFWGKLLLKPGQCLIHSRIYEILPQRIQQWQQSPCIAEEHGKKQLERIRRDQQNARLRLTEMERRFHELEGIIAKAKQQAVQQDEEVSASESCWVSMQKLPWSHNWGLSLSAVAGKRRWWRHRLADFLRFL